MHAESLPDLRMAEKEPHMKALITTAYGDVDKLTVADKKEHRHAHA